LTSIPLAQHNCCNWSDHQHDTELPHFWWSASVDRKIRNIYKWQKVCGNMNNITSCRSTSFDFMFIYKISTNTGVKSIHIRRYIRFGVYIINLFFKKIHFAYELDRQMNKETEQNHFLSLNLNTTSFLWLQSPLLMLLKNLL